MLRSDDARAPTLKEVSDEKKATGGTDHEPNNVNDKAVLRKED